MKKRVIVGVALIAVVALGSLAHQEWQRRERVQRCRQYVQEAYQKALADIGRRADGFSFFVKSRKANAADFSKEATGLYSKWRKLKELFPGTDPAGHKKFIREQFEARIFSEAEISQRMREAIDGAVKDIEGIENELAVKLKQEIVGQTLKPAEITSVHEEFRRLLNDQINASGNDAAQAAIQMVGSELAANIGAQVVVRLATSAGFIAAGAGTGWWTLGAGLAIGLAVDAIWTAVTDPAGKIEADVLKALDQLAVGGKQSLESELVKVLEAKKTQWELYVSRNAGAKPPVP